MHWHNIPAKLMMEEASFAESSRAHCYQTIRNDSLPSSLGNSRPSPEPLMCTLLIIDKGIQTRIKPLKECVELHALLF